MAQKCISCPRKVRRNQDGTVHEQCRKCRNAAGAPASKLGRKARAVAGRGVEAVGDEAPPSSERTSRVLKGSGRDVIKRFRKLGALLGLNPGELLEQAQVECALGYLNRIQAAATGKESKAAPAIPSSPMFIPRPLVQTSGRFETDELDSPRRTKLKDALKGGSAECDGCGGVVNCHKTCTVRKYPVVGAA